MTREQVIFCGENPELRLYRDGTEAMIAIASYWHCAYSTHGTGHALFLWVAPEVMPFHALYTDNPSLAQFLAQTLVQHFDGFEGLGFDRLAPKTARFVQTGDSRQHYRVFCYTNEGEIAVEWRNVLDYRLPKTYANLFERTTQETQHDVQNVICPVEAGAIVIGGTPIPGQVHSFHDGTMHRSSAFLAFSETWTERTP